MNKYNRNLKHHSEYLPLYHKLPVDKKGMAAELLGFKSCSTCVRSKYVTDQAFKKFNDFYNHVTKDKQSPNTIGLPVEFDNEQKKHYLTELTNWINSEEYSLATMKIRNGIIAEHNRINKQLNNNINN